MESFSWLRNSVDVTTCILGIGGIVTVSLIAAGLARLMRSRSVAARHSILLSGLLACFVAPIVAAAVSVSDRPLLMMPRKEVLLGAASEAEVVSEADDSEPVASLVQPTVGEASSGHRPATSTLQAMPTSHTPNSSSMRSESQPKLSLTFVFSAMWLIGTILLLTFSIRSLFRVQRIRRRAAECESDDLQDAASRAAHRVGLQKVPRLLQSEMVKTPAVAGFRVFDVILPRQVLNLVDKSELTDVLTHEFAHVRRRDQWIVLLQTAARCLFWPVVTVHWLNRELECAREDVCDNYVLSHSSSVSYGGTLLKLAELAIGTRPLPASVGMLSWKGKVEQRIEGLLDEKRDSQTSVGISRRILTLAAFVALSAVACGTRIVDAEPPIIDQPKGEERDDPDKADFKRQPDPANTGRFQMTVQDADGKSVAGGEVVLWQIKFGGGSRSVPSEYQTGFKTGSDGSVTIPYPRQTGVRRNRTVGLAFSIQHSGSPTWSGYRAIDDESPFKLPRSTRVFVTAKTEDGRLVDSDLHAITNGLGVSWTLASGTLHSGAIDISGERSSNLLRVVHGPENGPILFSDLIDLTQAAQQDNAITIEAILKPSARVVGKLSENVPRPVKNGKVLGSILSDSERFNALRWQVVADVEEDGSFVLTGLPARDTLQLIAVCDGWISLPPRPSEVEAYAKLHNFRVHNNHGFTTGRVTPQLRYVTEGTSETTVTMHQTGNAKVKVVDWDDNPVVGATISFAPNQALHNGGSSILGTGSSSLESLRNLDSDDQRRATSLQQQTNPRAGYSAVSDENGEATVRNIPAHRTVSAYNGHDTEGGQFVGFHVTHSDYVLVPKEPQRIFSSAGVYETVDMIPGETAAVRVRMDRKQEPKRSQTSSSEEPSQTRKATTGTPTTDRSQNSDKDDSILIDVSGKVTTYDGKAVAGVEVQLVSTNGLDKKLGVAETTNDGTYRFDKVAMPIRKSNGSIPGGTIEVFAAVDGYGLAWHGMRSVLLKERPDSDSIGPQQTRFYKGEPISMDLVLPRRAALTGQVLDNLGKPVPDTTILLGTLDYLDTEGRVYHRNYREFRALQFVPAERRRVKTGQDGRFEIDGLPADSVGMVRVSHDNYADQTVIAAVTDREISEYRYISNSRIGVINGETNREPIFETQSVTAGPLAITVAPNRHLDIQVRDTDDKPLGNVFVVAVSVEPGTHAAGRSDAEGKVRLALPSGDYRLTATPTRDTDFVRTSDKVTITDDAVTKASISMQTGCILILKAIDADTGQPIKGINFWRELDDKPGSRTGLNTVPYTVDHPTSDDNGELRAVVDPGVRSYGVGFSILPSPYRGGGGPGRKIECELGKTVRVTFELRKSS